MTKNNGVAGLFATASILALTSAAYAQTAPASEIVVTGSRVITNGNNSPTPLTVVSTEQMLAVQPTTVADALNELPEFDGSRTQESNPGPSSSNASAAYLTLRNLGDTRTLILYDGHRMPPTSPTGDVDVNQIPQLLLQRVDVVTGGASAVYGSDAVAGVVNFITDTKFNGFKMNLRTGVSQYGDDKTFDGSGAWGQSFMGGKLHVEASYEFNDDPGIFSRLSRPWAQDDPTTAGAGTVASPDHIVFNTRLSNTSFGGLITSGALNGLEFAQNGVLTPFVHGAPTGTTNIESGGDGGYYSTASLKSLQVLNQLFTRADYDFTNNIHGYLQIVGNLVRNEDQHQLNEVRGSTNFGVLGYNNAYLAGAILPAGTANPYTTACTTNTAACTFALGKMMLQQGTFQPETFESNYALIGGLDGSFDGYKWSLGYTHSYGVQQTQNNNNENGGKLLAAENAVINPANGQVVCHAALVNPAYANCVPLNLFGPTSSSAAALQYISAVTTYWARTQFDDVTGSLTGAPISTWAGPVTMAVSGEYHDLRYDLVSNAQPGDHPDCTGIQFGCSPGVTLLWVTNVLANRSPVSQSVWEVAYETDIPLAKDLPFMQSFDINGAIRYTDYSNSGGVDTWKIGADWHVNDQLTLRATRSRDIRAPNLNELYAPLAISPNGFTDLHTGNTQNQLNQYTQANPNLVPEQADTTSAGLVWKPSFVPRLSFSVDAYRITINDAIISVTGGNANVQAACEASGGTSVFCGLIVRPLPFSNHTPANFPLYSISEALNIASIDSYGADFETNYAASIFDHNFTVRVLASYEPHQVYNLGPGGIIDMGDAAAGQGNPLPSWKITGLVNFEVTKEFKISMEERWRDSMKQNGSSSLIWAPTPVAAVSYTDMNFSYDLNSSVGQTQIFLNIKNIFNQQPVLYGGGTTVPGLFGSYVLGDDDIGRYFTVGLHFRH